jgi:hypothetical protein
MLLCPLHVLRVMQYTDWYATQQADLKLFEVYFILGLPFLLLLFRLSDYLLRLLSRQALFLASQFIDEVLHFVLLFG